MNNEDGGTHIEIDIVMQPQIPTIKENVIVKNTKKVIALDGYVFVMMLWQCFL